MRILSVKGAEKVLGVSQKRNICRTKEVFPLKPKGRCKEDPFSMPTKKREKGGEELHEGREK